MRPEVSATSGLSAGSAVEPPLATVVIPCLNERMHIRESLESALNQRELGGRIEVIIADGMSTDGTRELVMEMAAKDPRIVLVDNPRRIASAGLNAAIRTAKGDVIVRMDAHTEYADDYVKECLAALNATSADNVGGPARTKAVGRMQRAIAAAYHSPFAVGGARFHDTEYEGYLDTVTYGCWRRESLERFGYFDEELVRNQDDEHNLRIVRGGGKIYQTPRIRSWYRPRPSLKALYRQYMQYGYWKVRVIQKHRLPASPRHLAPGGFVLFLFACLLGGFFSPVVAGVGLAAASTYVLAVLLASLLTARKTGWDLLPVLPLVFPCYHFGYGLGFVSGFWDFMIRKKAPGGWSVKLTRGGNEGDAKGPSR